MEQRSTAVGLGNDYLDEVVALLGDGRDDLSCYTARRELCARYAWAIPDDPALDALAALGPIVEAGAGSGYWAALLAARGVDVVAYDAVVPGTAPSEFGHWLMWHPVRAGGPERLAGHDDRALLLCWPPYDDPFAHDCLRAYTGTTVAYIGEPAGGCTGDDAFHELLERDFTVVETVTIPTWPRMYDRLTVHRRR